MSVEVSDASFMQLIGVNGRVGLMMGMQDFARSEFQHYYSEEVPDGPYWLVTSTDDVMCVQTLHLYGDVQEIDPEVVSTGKGLSMEEIQSMRASLSWLPDDVTKLMCTFAARKTRERKSPVCAEAHA
jgi:hypothetical protein